MYKVALTPSKAIYAFGGAIMSFTQNIQQAMMGLLLCMAIDTITGFWAAPHRGQRRESNKLSRFVTKIITYFTATIAIHIVEMMVLPSYVAGTLELARMIMTVFCALEIYSTCENLRDITGLKVFDIITMNFKKKIEESTGLDIPNEKDKK